MELSFYSQLPDDLLYEICCLTGQFRIHYNHKINKCELIDIIDLTQQKWITFNEEFKRCVNLQKILRSPHTMPPIRIGDAVCFTGSRGHIYTRCYVTIRL